MIGLVDQVYDNNEMLVSMIRLGPPYQTPLIDTLSPAVIGQIWGKMRQSSSIRFVHVSMATAIIDKTVRTLVPGSGNLAPAPV